MYFILLIVLSEHSFLLTTLLHQLSFIRPVTRIGRICKFWVCINTFDCNMTPLTQQQFLSWLKLLATLYMRTLCVTFCGSCEPLFPGNRSIISAMKSNIRNTIETSLQKWNKTEQNNKTPPNPNKNGGIIGIYPKYISFLLEFRTYVLSCAYISQIPQDWFKQLRNYQTGSSTLLLQEYCSHIFV